ncbi:MAG: hypothetical protein JSS20_20560 [Proteobacteria bacterium]|nr:hypothetical protein [Pseudomonadota bacterium]
MQKAIAAADPASQRYALSCLAQIVSTMNITLSRLDEDMQRGGSGRVTVDNGMLQAPVRSDRVQPVKQ